MRRRRSLFGPLLLIAAGVLLLLVQMGRVPLANLWALAYLWPVLLIFAGLGLIFRQSLPWAWDLLAVLVVIALFLAVIYAPQLGLRTTPVLGASPFVFFGRVATGDVIRQNRTVSGFNAVSVSYPADVTITQGAAEALSIEAPSDILPEIQTEVQNGELRISVPPGVFIPLRPPNGTVKIDVTVKNLSAIDFSGAGRVQGIGIQTDEMRATVSGAGSLNLVDLSARNLAVVLSGAGGVSANGRSTLTGLDVKLSGVGSFDGSGLQVQAADVDISGAGGATVWVTGQLTAQISGLGSIRYYGNPNVIKHVSGLGGVEALGAK